MKCYGYSKTDDEELLELREITILADSKDLHHLASFLVDCAVQIDSNPDWEHEHLSDYISTHNISLSSDIIVFKPSK